VVDTLTAVLEGVELPPGEHAPMQSEKQSNVPERDKLPTTRE